MMLIFTACYKTSDVETVQDNEQDIEQDTTKEPTVQESIPPEPSEEPMPDGAEKVSILLMGAKEKDFSDPDSRAYVLTHILITLDPKERTIKFTTFPYNLGVDVETDEGTELMQLQFVCTNMGEDAAAAALEQNFSIDIDYYVLMNMKGVIDVVDALEGIEVEVAELTINETGEHVAQVLGLMWQEVKSTGLQVLSGMQTAGFFNDTFNVDPDNWLEEEELIFRERHPSIINGVIAAVKLAGLKSDDMVTIAGNVSGNYKTDIPEEKWMVIADTALYCIQNEAQFLHIPQQIDTLNHDGNPPIVYDEDIDITAVQSFIGE